MADGTAPVIGKGASMPTAPEMAAAPNAADPPSFAVCPPNPANLQGDSDQSSGLGKDGETKRPDGGPKPVEVTSVLETPANAASPAGGISRPELTIQEEHAPSAQTREEPVVMMEATKPQPMPRAPMPENDARPDAATGKATAPNGAHKPATATPASFEKKSVSSTAPPASASAPEYGTAGPTTETTVLATAGKRKIKDIARGTSPSVEPEGLSAGEKATEKKAKVDAVARKIGWPKKVKNSLPLVGKTARKTRSQGPVDM